MAPYFLASFGELTWGVVMDHWKRFASFYFLYHYETNPEGLPAVAAALAAAEGGRKGAPGGGKTDKAESKACSIM